MMSKERSEKMRTIQGRVVSDKMDKTRVIRIETIKLHPIFRKSMKRTRRLKIHDEHNVSKEGDLVLAVETRPLSREKRHRLLKVLEQSK
jgi:small subunit ribosomal protein S17